MGEITVISKEVDGSRLRELKRTRPRHIVATGGKGDVEKLKEADHNAGKSQWSIPSSIWERIFGRK